MSELANKRCIPCRGGVPALAKPRIDVLLTELDNWSIDESYPLVKEFRFLNFKDALAFVNRVGEIAEEQGHHPDIELTHGFVRIRIFTHKIQGLTESDFILAAKIDQITKADCH